MYVLNGESAISIDAISDVVIKMLLGNVVNAKNLEYIPNIPKVIAGGYEYSFQPTYCNIYFDHTQDAGFRNKVIDAVQKKFRKYQEYLICSTRLKSTTGGMITRYQITKPIEKLHVLSENDDPDRMHAEIHKERYENNLNLFVYELSNLFEVNNLPMDTFLKKYCGVLANASGVFKTEKNIEFIQDFEISKYMNNFQLRLNNTVDVDLTCKFRNRLEILAGILFVHTKDYEDSTKDFRDIPEDLIKKMQVVHTKNAACETCKVPIVVAGYEYSVAKDNKKKQVCLNCMHRKIAYEKNVTTIAKLLTTDKLSAILNNSPNITMIFKKILLGIFLERFSLITDGNSVRGIIVNSNGETFVGLFNTRDITRKEIFNNIKDNFYLFSLFDTSFES